MAEINYKKTEIVFEVEIDSPDIIEDNDSNSNSCFKLVIQKLKKRWYDFLQRRRYQRNIRILFKN